MVRPDQLGVTSRSSGPQRAGSRRSVRCLLTAYSIALFASVGVAGVDSTAAADAPTSGFQPLATDWPNGAVPDNEIPAAVPDEVQYIIDGTLAAEGEFPWMAFLLVVDAADDLYQCGGTLIAPTIVLTAAHCVESAEVAAVIVGRNSPLTAPESALVFADGVAIHPDYVTDGAQGDIALLRLKTPVTQPIVPLAHPEDAVLSGGGVTATVAGWGITAPEDPPADQLQKGSMPIRSALECRTANELYVDASNVCAGYLTGEGFAPTGACKGDSGGPLLVATPDSRTSIQVGIVSYGPESGCAELDEPIVYMRVAYYLSWIESIAGDVAGPPETTTTTSSTTTTTTTATTTTIAATTTTIAAATTTIAAATTTVASPTTVVSGASPTTTATSSFAASASGSSGGSGGSLVATGSSGWLTFVPWALVALIVGRMIVLVARRPAIR